MGILMQGEFPISTLMTRLNFKVAVIGPKTEKCPGEICSEGVRVVTELIK